MYDRMAIGLDSATLNKGLRQAKSLTQPFISDIDYRPSSKYHEQFLRSSTALAEQAHKLYETDPEPDNPRLSGLKATKSTNLKSNFDIKASGLSKISPSALIVNDVILRNEAKSDTEPKHFYLDRNVFERDLIPQKLPTPQTQPFPIAPEVAVEERKPKRRFSPIRSIKTRSHQYTKMQWAFMSMASLVFAVGISVSAYTYMTNKVDGKKVASLSTSYAAGNQPASSDVSGNGSVSGAGGQTPPSTVRPTAAEIQSYAVGPTLPKYLIIPKLEVDARVLSVGLLNNGALATPNNVFDAAWYNESSLPGQAGAELIDGHVSSWTSHGVFYGIKNLTAGDKLEVVTGNNTTYTYSVVQHTIYDHNNVDMQAAITPIIANKPGLNLITCTGDVIPGTNEFNERIVVYATLDS